MCRTAAATRWSGAIVSRRLTIAIGAILAVWLLLASLAGRDFKPPRRPYGAFSMFAIEKHAEGSFMYVMRFDRHAGIADTDEHPERSPIEIFENELRLGPAHSRTSDIGERGHGRYRHAETALYFSTSDNTDPRSNGRNYSWTYGPLQSDFKRR